jgi:tetratricopeptide (TPR) repeat protein
MRVILALLLSASLGQAQPSNEAEAKAHYLRGAQAYEKGQYDTALDEFLKSWRLTHNPTMLFNLARVEDRLGHDEQAIGFLRQYLIEQPDSPDVPTVRSEIEAHEKTMAERRARAAAEAQVAQVSREAKNRAEQARRTDQRRLQIAGWAMLGVGLATLAGGIVAGGVAEHDASTVSSAGDTRDGRAPAPFSRYANAAAEGPTADRVGLALDIVGGIITAAGIVLAIVSHRHLKAEGAATTVHF